MAIYFRRKGYFSPNRPKVAICPTSLEKTFEGLRHLMLSFEYYDMKIIFVGKFFILKSHDKNFQQIAKAMCERLFLMKFRFFY